MENKELNEQNKPTCVLLNTSMIDEKWIRPILRPLLKPSDEVAVLAFSFFDDTKTLDDWNRQYAPGQGIWYRSNTDVFAWYGIGKQQVHWINYFTDTPQEMIGVLEKCTVLLLTGGAPDLMMKRIKEKKLKKILKGWKGLVIGYSAGAMVMLDDYHIIPDEDYSTFSWQKGIGWLSGFDIEPHYRASNDQKNWIAKVFEEKQKPVYALYEDGGMVAYPDGRRECFGKVDIFDHENCY